MPDRVLVRRHEARGSDIIELPESAKVMSCFGEVIAVGCGPAQTKKGDTVVFCRMSGQAIELEDGREILMLRDDELLGVVE